MQKNDWLVPGLYLIWNLHVILVFTSSFFSGFNIFFFFLY